MKNKFRNELLQQTIFHAVTTTEFYANYYYAVDWRRIDTINDLYKLPTVDKEVLRNAGERARSNSIKTDFLQNTSGTSGPVFLIHRSQFEQKFINNFFTKVFSKSSESDEYPVQLSLVAPDHGSAFRISIPVHVIEQSIFDNRSAENTAQILNQAHNLGGSSKHIEIVSGPLHQVIKLTQYMLQRKLQIPQNIKLINLTGDFLTLRQYNYLSRVWSARINSRYSQSEIFGGASSTRDAEDFSRFVFDPQVIPELCNETITKNGNHIGEMVLTSLYPFVQRSPFIRYATGDTFVKIKNDINSEDEYVFLGRKKHCLFDKKHLNKLILSSAIVLDELDEFPFTFREKENKIDMIDTSSATLPQFIGKVLSDAIIIYVKLIVDPDSYTNFLNKQLQLCAKKIFARHKNLGITFGNRKLIINGVGPNDPRARHFQAIDLETDVWDISDKANSST